MAKDLVCGMDVDEKCAKHKTLYQGKYYYFCAAGCKKAFEEEPELYLHSEISEDQHPTHHHHHEGEDTKSCGCGCGGH
jgi:YHS domain-containing protein